MVRYHRQLAAGADTATALAAVTDGEPYLAVLVCFGATYRPPRASPRSVAHR